MRTRQEQASSYAVGEQCARRASSDALSPWTSNALIPKLPLEQNGVYSSWWSGRHWHRTTTRQPRHQNSKYNKWDIKTNVSHEVYSNGRSSERNDPLQLGARSTWTAVSDQADDQICLALAMSV